MKNIEGIAFWTVVAAAGIVLIWWFTMMVQGAYYP